MHEVEEEGVFVMEQQNSLIIILEAISHAVTLTVVYKQLSTRTVSDPNCWCCDLDPSARLNRYMVRSMGKTTNIDYFVRGVCIKDSTIIWSGYIIF
jgi:hypothetical protein